MRITGGQATGTVIRAPRGMQTRPTTDKLREAVFNTLGTEVTDRRVLDLFAGSGALGVEALSRGAQWAAFVEKNLGAARIIAGNLKRAGLSERAEIIPLDFRFAIRKLEKRGETFDLVFIDPPYQSNLFGDMAAIFATHCVVSKGAIIILEHFKKTKPPSSISGIPFFRTRNYGQTSLSYFH